MAATITFKKKETVNIDFITTKYGNVRHRVVDAIM